MVITGCGGGGGGGGSTPVSLSSTKVITGFSLNDCFGMIDEAEKTIAVTMPLGTDVTTLVATFYTNRRQRQSWFNRSDERFDNK